MIIQTGLKAGERVGGRGPANPPRTVVRPNRRGRKAGNALLSLDVLQELKPFQFFIRRPIRGDGDRNSMVIVVASHYRGLAWGRKFPNIVPRQFLWQSTFPGARRPRPWSNLAATPIDTINGVDNMTTCIAERQPPSSQTTMM